VNQFIEPPPKVLYKRPGSSEYEQLPHILDDILTRLEDITQRLEIIENGN
jgi:hypothetical protein